MVKREMVSHMIVYVVSCTATEMNLRIFLFHLHLLQPTHLNYLLCSDSLTYDSILHQKNKLMCRIWNL